MGGGCMMVIVVFVAVVVIMLVCMLMAMMGIVVSVGRHREVFLLASINQSEERGKTKAVVGWIEMGIRKTSLQSRSLPVREDPCVIIMMM